VGPWARWPTYADVIGRLDKKPAVIGHSFGGLLTQIIAGRGLSAASVAIDSAPIFQAATANLNPPTPPSPSSSASSSRSRRRVLRSALHGGRTGHHDAMTEPYTVDWASHTNRLVAAAHSDADWYDRLARELVRPGDRVAVDVGCGGAGMTAALAAALGRHGVVVAVDADAEVLAAARSHLTAVVPPGAGRVDFVEADLAAGVAPLRDALDGPVDVVWASASVHHLGDQQAGVTALAGLLAPGGRLALAEGGLSRRHLPWDLGIGDPGLELRLDAAQDRWFARMRAELPGTTRMPYGWTEALRRAGLTQVTTRSTLLERPTPLDDGDRVRAVDGLNHRVDRLRPTGLLDAGDLAAWDRLLDPADPAWLGHRGDLGWLEVRSVHLGVRVGEAGGAQRG